MKKSMLAALLALALLVCSGCAAEEAAGKTIVTSFYPMYVFTQNVARDVPGVRVVNMAAESVGCLHDYQLQTRDMVTLEGADALVINGGGMEQFMDKVIAQRPELPVINASDGIDMLCSEDEHDHGHGDHDHDHGVYNAHVWLDPKLAIRQVQNIADGLAAVDSENAEAYQQNAAAYKAQIQALDAELSAQLAPLAGSAIVTFHEAFTYFADAYGLVVAGVIASDAGEEPSTRQIAATCDLVKQRQVKALFVEPQYPTKSAETIARETGAKVFTLDPVVSGDASPESYENAMRENARVLTEALEP
ncbi:MAG: zinc ABC transporter substrate-binding protein [Clostridia bacterium]|nr:zinc ABC transporter substrate-binding protein [Clostridia bacterium]